MTLEWEMKGICAATIESFPKPTKPRNRQRRQRTPRSKQREQLVRESTDTEPWETGSIAQETLSEISDLSPENTPRVLINDENMVMVDLNLSWGVISSSIKPENGATIKEPVFFDTKGTPSGHEEEKLLPENGPYSKKEVEETDIMEPRSCLEPLSAAELDHDFEEPAIVIPPSPKLTSISEGQEPLVPNEEDEVFSSLDEETEVEALLNDCSREEKEKEQEEKSADSIDDELQTPDLEIQRKMKESLSEEIRRLIYPADYLKAETTEPSPEKEGTVPMNATKAILKRKKLGAKQRKRLRKSKEELTKQVEETTKDESGSQIWWKDETIMRQILANPGLYPPPDDFPSELTSASDTQADPESSYWEMEENDNESFTKGQHLRSGIF